MCALNTHFVKMNLVPDLNRNGVPSSGLNKASAKPTQGKPCTFRGIGSTLG